ncbi:MAG TPA: hypothetical protein VLF93_00670 [Candidatus Saccharimonadales bacterium]|nr:hypothetical protein [Candidatus Saccharimonadales bacterium]
MKTVIFVVAGMLTCVALLAMIVMLVTHHTAKLPSIPNKGIVNTTLPQPTVDCTKFPSSSGCKADNTPINICTEQHPNYPLLSSILTTPANRNLGVVKGNITNLNNDTHSITVTSQTNGKPFVFQNDSVKDVLYDIHLSKTNNFTKLKTGMKAVISFPCKQKTGSFILNQFQLVQ